MKVLLIWSELGWEYKSGYINSIKLLKKTSYSSAIPVMALKEEIVQPIPFLFWLYCTYRIPELFRTQDFWKVSVGTRLWAADPSGLLQEHCWSLLSSVASSRWAPRYTAWWHCGPSPVSVIRVKPPDCIAGQQHSTTWTLLSNCYSYFPFCSDAISHHQPCSWFSMSFLMCICRLIFQGYITLVQKDADIVNCALSAHFQIPITES